MSEKYYLGMCLTNKWWVRLLLLLITFHSSLITSLAMPKVLPQAQAAHFCRILVSDGESTMPLNAHLQRVIESSDSLTCEQIFVEYLLRDKNWQSLRFFPHRQDDGTVAWYAPADELPTSLDAEHQKYIREVFPRLLAEVQEEHWSTVDDYIDRMVQYQCQFGGQKASMPVSSTFLVYTALSILAILFLSSLIFVNLQHI